ncbi:MAG: hypothetical protein M1836_007091 [Candelina mexicana]|nr:MAG: hypothetical protein M1836_007091 [Candelina mexicana]
MHILVVNDDGPPSNQSSPYVHSFVDTLQKRGHTVSVVLPHTQRSWIGKAHIVGAVIKPTYFRPGTLHEDDGTTHSRPLTSGSSGDEWILVDGTPASCVQIGLYHFFQDRDPVDLVISGPNYGRNTTAVFSLSSGTLGGAMEGAVCRKKAIALSYAFFSRNHDPNIIAGASRLSVKLVEHLYNNWGRDVDLYTINVPLVEDIEKHKIMYTTILQNYWSSGSSFQELEVEAEGGEPEEHEEQIRSGEGDLNGKTGPAIRHKHKHFKWAPKFTDVYQGVENSAPGNDGWAVKEGYTSITPLKANFMQAPGLEGELKLSEHPPNSKTTTKRRSSPLFHAVVDYDDPYVQPMIIAALDSQLPTGSWSRISSTASLPDPALPLLQFASYEAINFEHLLTYPRSSLATAYTIRKALIRKHYLSNTLASWFTKYPASGLSSHVQPAVHFELDYAEFLDEALVEAYELHQSFKRNAGKQSSDREWWLLKPGMTDSGQGIRLFSSEEELRQIFEEWEDEESATDDEGEKNGISGDSDGSATSPKLIDRGSSVGNSSTAETHKDRKDYILTSQLRHFIAQPYIHPPLLLPASGHRKFHIRTYVLAVGSLKVYVYRDMLVLFAAETYVEPGEEGGRDLRKHLTNTCLQDGSREGSVQRFWDLQDQGTKDAWKEGIFEQICEITGEIFEAAARGMMVHFQTLPNAFEIFGLDFLVDAEYNIWLLEVNAFPDFKQTGEELKGVVQGLFEQAVDIGIAPFFGVEAIEGAGGWMHRVLDIDLGRR